MQASRSVASCAPRPSLQSRRSVEPWHSIRDFQNCGKDTATGRRTPSGAIATPTVGSDNRDIVWADENENVYDLVGLMKRFIEHMMRVVDHELISDIHQQLIARISVLRVLSMSMPGRIQSSMGELTDVIEAIERRDADAAAESLTYYVRNAANAALARFDATQAES